MRAHFPEQRLVIKPSVKVDEAKVQAVRDICFVGFSQSCYRLQIFVWQGLSHKLADQNKVVKIAHDVDKMNLAFKPVLEYFKLQNLKILSEKHCKT